jgi:2-oxoglutarate ferredoxin oxidoreductase subunit delta
MAKQGRVEIDAERCKACYLCVKACPVGALAVSTTMNSSGLFPSRLAKPEACIGCANCFEVCPDICIRVFERKEAGDAD